MFTDVACNNPVVFVTTSSCSTPFGLQAWPTKW
jgi:hypothetical protein